MKTVQFHWNPSTGWDAARAHEAKDASLVLVFGDHPHFQDAACHAELRRLFPAAHIVGCSSAGSVLKTSISDNDIVATAVTFEKGYAKVVTGDLDKDTDIAALARRMLGDLDDGGLKHVFILSDGLNVNGSELAQGFHKAGGDRIAVTGGLAGDGSRFGNTWVMADAPARQYRIAAIGFHGDCTVRSGCCAGWEEFGAERMVTQSRGNIVYRIDDQPALTLYKKYLGSQAEELPASGLRFPLSVRSDKESPAIIRTLLAVDEAAQSLIFAGDVPEGHICKLMRTNISNLIDGAATAATHAHLGAGLAGCLCLVVSCVGRRLVLGQLTEEELEVVQEKLGPEAGITGFYSYGEIAPFGDLLQCQLHNQTMTLTTVYE